MSSPDLVVEGTADRQKFIDSLNSILQGTALCSMATVGPDNVAHCNTAFFCYSTVAQMYFISHYASAHSKNLAERPSMAWTVFDSHQVWGNLLRGLQIFGTAKPAGVIETGLGLKAYTQRFPGFAKTVMTTSLSEFVAAEYRFYVFTPQRFKLFDEAVFGEETYVSAVLGR